MSLGPKSIDTQVLKDAAMKAIEASLSKMAAIPPSQEPDVQEVDIIEYEGKMRVSGIEKFNAPCYISYVHYFLSAADQKTMKPKGALVLYVDSENASKIFKALGMPFNDDEDDASMMEVSSKFCASLSQSFKEALSAAGLPDLEMNAPESYRNNVLGGIEFSPDQQKKLEIALFYWKRKSLVVELTMATLPLKK